MVFKVPRLRLSLHPQIPPRMQDTKKMAGLQDFYQKSCNLFLVLTLYSGQKIRPYVRLGKIRR